MNIRSFYNRYYTKDPYSEVSALCAGVPYDVYVPKSWGSTNVQLRQLVDMIKPQSIIEIGTWKGASAVHITEQALRHHRDVAVLCIDTWLSSNPALWKNKKHRDSVLTQKIERTQYTQFLCNILHAKLKKHILPFRCTTRVALELLNESKVEVDLIYIDAGHLKDEVASDIAGSWKILKRGGALIGDDFSASFPGVQQAVREFAKKHKAKLLVEGQKWWMCK